VPQYQLRYWITHIYKGVA